MALRNLVLVLGDQLDPRSSAFDGFDAQRDAVWMAENVEEATHVWCHKQRLVLFFSAMRHFRDELAQRGIAVDYHALTADGQRDAGRDLGAILKARVRRLQPQRLIVVEPGDWRVQQTLAAAASELGLELDIRPDRHFYCDRQAFADWARGKKALVMEAFYRWMRKRHDVLMTGRGTPVGGAWNFDKANRESFGPRGPAPGSVPPLPRLEPDAITRSVIDLVERRFADHPGSLQRFNWPVTRQQALTALEDFIARRLPRFGRYEDAMWDSQPVLYHSRLSAALNLHLLDPRELVDAAVQAHRRREIGLNNVEGFVRQILGWREFIRGVYWLHMPDYASFNALGNDDRDVPDFFWTGDTDMNCVRTVMADLLAHGWTHHIHRLMVLGLYSLLLGVHPRKFHDWHMALYVDAIDWVSLPNALGMSQYGDGGVVGTKPYCASGKYIQRMSNYCSGCRYDPAAAVGDDACPFTTLYWDFLARHRQRFEHNPRMVMQVRNLDRKPERELRAIRARATRLAAAAGPGDSPARRRAAGA